MNDAIFSDYARRMNNITLSDAQRTSILAAVAREREDARVARAAATAAQKSPAAPGSARRPGRAAPARRFAPTRRAVLIAACTAGLMLGTALVGGVLAGTQGGRDGSAAQGGGALPSGLPAGAFILTAYADGTPVEGSTGTVLAGPGFLDYVSAWDGGWSDDGSGTLAFHCTYDIDLGIHGDDVESVVYEIDGDGSAQFSYLDSPHREAVTDTTEEQHGQRISVTRDQLDRVGTIDGGTFSLEMYFTIPQDRTDIYDLARRLDAFELADDADYDAYNALFDEYRALTLACGADLLAGRIITVTATLADGAEAAHRYRIEPVEDFEAVYLGNEQESRDRVEAGAQDRMACDPLFTIEQLD